MHMLSKKGRFGWICIPKVASVAIRTAIQEFDRDAKTVSLDDLGYLQDKLFIFAFIRHPLSRLISTYRDIVKGGNRDAPRLTKVGLNVDSSWSSFLKMVEKEIEKEDCDVHWRPQVRFLDHIKGAYFQQLETISLHWITDIMSKTGLGRLRHIHKSETPAPVYTEAEKDHLLKLYEEDYALWENLKELS